MTFTYILKYTYTKRKRPNSGSFIFIVSSLFYFTVSTVVVSTEIESTQLVSTDTDVESVDVFSELLAPKLQAVNKTDKIAIVKIVFFILIVFFIFIYFV
jgi:hypothetical protein